MASIISGHDLVASGRPRDPVNGSGATPLSFAAARDALYGVAIEAFVAERARLTRALKSAGDKAGAAELAKLPRPVLSAWVVNQLWRHERAGFDALLAHAIRLRAGEPGAARAHRDALAALRQRAGELLAAAGHDGSNEATLRRVYLNLAALAAQAVQPVQPVFDGGFDPGAALALAGAALALAADLEAPGFDVLDGATIGEAHAPGAQGRADDPAGQRRRVEAERQRQAADELAVSTAAATAAAAAAAAASAAEAAAAAAAAAAERRRLEAELARLDDRIRAGLVQLQRHDRAVESLRADLARAEAARLDAHEAVVTLRSERAALVLALPTPQR